MVKGQTRSRLIDLTDPGALRRSEEKEVYLSSSLSGSSDNIDLLPAAASDMAKLYRSSDIKLRRRISRLVDPFVEFHSGED